MEMIALIGIMTCLLPCFQAFLISPPTMVRRAVARCRRLPFSVRITSEDNEMMGRAIENARLGLGSTFPNPAVGCVLVDQATHKILGSGFHPKAGYPHAEVFALLEAAGHVDSGVAAAKSVGGHDIVLLEKVDKLAEQYKSDDGQVDLFGGLFQDDKVTAFVTLEPCCHSGRTPPCAGALVQANVDRVVIGMRDPNPKVDGGGVDVLRNAGIEVEVVDGDLAKGCEALVSSFVKRVSPKGEEYTDFSWITGAMRRSLRKMAALKKQDGDLTQVSWSGAKAGDDEASVDALVLEAPWMERLDNFLWEHELVNMRLNAAVGKKKLAKQLANRISLELGAHVCQVIGHSALLYRPGLPPKLDLNEISKDG